MKIFTFNLQRFEEDTVDIQSGETKTISSSSNEYDKPVSFKFSGKTYNMKLSANVTVSVTGNADGSIDVSFSSGRVTFGKEFADQNDKIKITANDIILNVNSASADFDISLMGSSNITIGNSKKERT